MCYTLEVLLLKTLGRLGLQDATGTYTYQGTNSLLLLCYLADRYAEGKRQHNREALVKLLWPRTQSLKNRKNNLSVALKHLREALAGAEIVRLCEDSDPYDPSLELHPDSLSLTSLNSNRLVTVDFTVCEAACAARDLVTVSAVYEGVFLAGVEKRASNVAGELLTWLQEKRSSLASTVLEACLEVLHDVYAPPDQRQAAQGLLEQLSEHEPHVFIDASLLADAHAYLPARQQTDLAGRLQASLAAPETQAYRPLLMTMALQHEPNFEVACRVQHPPLMGAPKAHCKQFLEDGDWLQVVTAASDGSGDGSSGSGQGSGDGSSKNKQPSHTRLRGQAFWQRQAVAKAQHVLLLQRLWRETPERPETYAELFHLAWHYHQGVAPTAAPSGVVSPGQRAGEMTLEQLIRADLEARSEANTHHQAAQGMGNFAGFDWSRLTRVFRVQAQHASRRERFAEVLALCDVWEGARQQRTEAQDAQMVWFAAYALERQGDYGAARERLREVANVSERHRALWASLQFRVGKTAQATDTARQLLPSADMWARAEAHSLLAKVAYFAEDYNSAIEHYERAKVAWEQADEPCRAIAAETGVASCYDYRSQAGDVDRANDIYNDLAEVIVRQGLPPLTGLRTRLNQLILWDYHHFKTPDEIRCGFTELIDTLERQDISSEVLGTAWYNFGQHYYNSYCAYADGVQDAYVDIHHSDVYRARVCYERALEQLKGSRDVVTYGCAHGELGRVYLHQHNRAQAQVCFAEAVDILSRTNQQSLCAEYQQLLVSEVSETSLSA